jgi:UDP-GlcNAc:undecaprenyl-phosphate GlcNAc-1-phosphate transferase
VNFPVALYLLAGLAAFATALIALPFWSRWCLRVGLVDDPGGRKTHANRMPLAGGLTIMTALIVPTLAGALAVILAGLQPATQPGVPHHSAPLFASNPVPLLAHGLERRGVELSAVLIGAFGLLVVGLLDDRNELKPATKFAGQLLVAALVAVAGARITLFVPNLVFSYTVTILWIVTVINAFNFVDNMNGLCGGLGAIAAFYFAAISAAAGQYLVTLVAALTCGALLGFLPHNFPRAKTFLGDSGSHLVGYLVALLAILPHFYTRKNPHVLAVLNPLLILAVPLGDLAWVVLVRWRTHRPFYVGDTSHLSHQLVRLGLSRTGAVVLIWLLAGLLGALSLI